MSHKDGADHINVPDPLSEAPPLSSNKRTITLEKARASAAVYRQVVYSTPIQYKLVLLDNEIDRQRAEIEKLRTLLRIARDEWHDYNGQWGDGFGLKHWTRKADALLSGEPPFHEPEKRHE